MKKRKLNKKLLLNKKTVANLNDKNLHQLRGGDPPRTLGGNNSGCYTANTLTGICCGQKQND